MYVSGQPNACNKKYECLFLFYAKLRVRSVKVLLTEHCCPYIIFSNICRTKIISLFKLILYIRKSARIQTVWLVNFYLKLKTLHKCLSLPL